MFGLLMLIGGIVLLVGVIAAVSVFLYFKIKLRRILDDAGFQGQNIGDIIREARLQDEVEPKSLASMDRIYLSQIQEDFPEMISEYEGKNVKFEDFKIHNTVLSNYKKDGKTASIFFASAYEYVLRVDGKEKKVQDRAKVEFIYVLDEAELSDKQNVIDIHCPNCNSPITNLGNHKCSYCGTAVVLVLGRVFACNDIKRY